MARRSREVRYARLRRLSDGVYPALTVRYGRRYLRDYPDHGFAWYLVGIELVCLGRYEEAEQAFSRAIALCPDERVAMPYAQMGHLFQQAGDHAQAEHWYRRAVGADPLDAGYRIFLGGLLAKAGRFAEAEAVHRSALNCPEGDVDEAYLNLALVLRARERFAEAADACRAALAIDPGYRAARVALRDVELCLKLPGGPA